MREHVLLFRLLGLVLTATIILVTAPFYVTSMIDLAQVPAPIVGGGPIGLVVCGLLIVGLARKYRRSTSPVPA
jgi:hypothetical protein